MWPFLSVTDVDALVVVSQQFGNKDPVSDAKSLKGSIKLNLL